MEVEWGRLGGAGTVADGKMERGMDNGRGQEENGTGGMRGRIHSLTCLATRA